MQFHLILHLASLASLHDGFVVRELASRFNHCRLLSSRTPGCASAVELDVTAPVTHASSNPLLSVVVTA